MEILITVFIILVALGAMVGGLTGFDNEPKR